MADFALMFPHFPQYMLKHAVYEWIKSATLVQVSTCLNCLPWWYMKKFSYQSQRFLPEFPRLLDRWPLAKLMKKESYLKRSVSWSWVFHHFYLFLFLLSVSISVLFWKCEPAQRKVGNAESGKLKVGNWNPKNYKLKVKRTFMNDICHFTGLPLSPFQDWPSAHILAKKIRAAVIRRQSDFHKGRGRAFWPAYSKMKHWLLFLLINFLADWQRRFWRTSITTINQNLLQKNQECIHGL